VSNKGKNLWWAIAVALCGLLLKPALAYEVYTDSRSGIYVITWYPGAIPMRLKVPTTNTFSDGTSYASTIQAAMQAWNSQLGAVQFTYQTTNTAAPAPAGTYSDGNGINEIVLDSTYGGSSFGTGVLAITLSNFNGNTHTESDIIFNTSWTWDSYRGPLNGHGSVVDIRRVAIHELGHVLGLDHPDQAVPQQNVAAIMNSRISNFDTLLPDDLAGAQLLYGAFGFVPANDNFANATPITLTGNVTTVTGSNVTATEETNEPNHAGADAKGQSVWWKWTAPASASATLTTLGSNFDTVVAVYTGNSLASLVSVASNDDVQSGVIRTSTVTFNAVAGTTYYIAVDGWGTVSQGDRFTYDGAITLNLTFAGNFPPAITTQPVSRNVTAGTSTTFTVVAGGVPAPSYQWQKNGVAIAGATAATYTVASVAAGDAGTYAVVITNSEGSVTSDPAVLTITVANSPPAFTTQPISQAAITGDTVSLTVAASGVPAPTFQWFKNGAAVPGATGVTLTLTNVQSSDAATYWAVATNSSGSATSSGAVLTVRALPAITTQPLSSAVFVGGSVTLVAAATGTPTPTVRWQRNGIDIPGATSATLTLNNIQVTDAGSYALVATNTAGSSTSHFARLVVLVPQANATTYTATVYPTGVTAGGNVGLDYLLTNIGTRNWGANHYLSIRDSNGTFVAFSTLIGANSGENKIAHLSFPAPTTPGTYTYTVQGLESGVEFFTTQTTFTLNVLAPQPNSITYNSTNFPLTATPGSNLIFNYNVTNTGTSNWGANHVLTLRDGAGTTQATSPLNGVTAGQSKAVNLSLTAPAAPGVYSYSVKAVETGGAAFQAQANVLLTVLAPQPNAVVYTSTRSQDNVTPGATVSLRYSLSNAGTGTWGASHYASLRDGAGNYLAFVPLSGIAPGGTTTVNFSLVAPTTPGIYTYFVQALQDGVEFFDSQDLVTLTVLATPIGNAATYNATTFPITAARGASVTFTSNVTNRGTKTWGANHYLSLRDADNVFLSFQPLTGVAPAASKTLTFNFTAPTSPGVYTYHLQGFESGIEFFAISDNLVLIVP